MKERVLANIEEYGLIERGDRIVIGLSGGPDSVFLFHILRELMEDLDFSIYIAHVNHGVRGEDALADQKFVEDLARKYDMAFYLKEADMDGYAREHNLSSEEAGRKIRYDFFNEILEELGGGKIAVGHNKSDQVETLLMRFFRGTGIDGLAGMDYKSGHIIRPILNIEREGLESYLEEKGYESRLDKTNLETIYNRNKIRLVTVPHIEENYNPGLIDTIFRSSENFKEDSQFLKSYTDRVFKKVSRLEEDRFILSRQKFLKEDRAIQARLLRKCLEKLRGNLQGFGQQHIYDSLAFIEDGATGKKIDLIDDINILLNYDDIVIARNIELELGDFSFDIGLGRQYIEELDLEIEANLLDIDEIESFDKNKYIKYFDYDKIKRDLQIRNRRNGDVFKPLGMNGRSKKIKDFFIDEKIPREERDKVLLLTEGDRIVWVVGHRISDEYKLTKESKRVMSLKISRRI